ncbi:MAG: hypothetical protein JNL18_22385 [Planctomycetaceae bacterium]|uniref:PEP-CTERM protein-sorting domain-containing protein n=1 Tax=Lacipirellula limnantheis TaxID=2528024 RepID=A0A517TYP0_9BACT|nr:hypothetical protein [Lacipirellula limnantheis]MBL9165491.1 hypothetical protein [Planctomycetaceae bacterium]QDT73484.1 hypothetical protein I41_26730 [Lacipirellula limnantheis]
MQRSAKFIRTSAKHYFIVVGILFLTGRVAYAGVFPNSDNIYGVSAPDPFYVQDGDRYMWLYGTESSGIVVNGGLIEKPTGLARSPIRLLNQATAVVNDGVLRDVVQRSASHVFHLEDHSHLTVNGGVFLDTSTSGELLYASNNSHATINGGSFTATRSAVLRTWFNGSITVNGGNFTADDDGALEHRGGGNVRINGGVFRSSRYALLVAQVGGILEIHGGEFDSPLGLQQRTGVIEWYARQAWVDGRQLEPGDILDGDGSLRLTFPDGNTQTIPFLRTGGVMRFIAVPEPSAAMLSSLLIFGIASRRRSC